MDIYQKFKQALAHSLTKPSVKWSVFLISIVLLFTVIGPNLEWLKSPLTPPVKLKVLDSETKKPVSDMYVVFRWVSNYTYFPGQGTGKSYHICIGKTDQNGEIKIGRKTKPLSYMIPPILYKEYSGIYYFTIDNRYKWAARSVTADGSAELTVQKINTVDDIMDNFRNYNTWANIHYSNEVTELLIKFKEEALNLSNKNNSKY